MLLTELMHSCGINMRYLGRIATRCHQLESIGGISKFILDFQSQMPLPDLVQLAKPLGAKKVQWACSGRWWAFPRSTKLQAAGPRWFWLLLLFRRTSLLGAALGAGVMAYVFLLNLSFDVPVKLFKWSFTAVLPADSGSFSAAPVGFYTRRQRTRHDLSSAATTTYLALGRLGLEGIRARNHPRFAVSASAASSQAVRRLAQQQQIGRHLSCKLTRWPPIRTCLLMCAGIRWLLETGNMATAISRCARRAALTLVNGTRNLGNYQDDPGAPR